MLRLGKMAASILTVCVFGCCAAVPAFAGSPWWHLSSSTRPTYLQPGQARDEVQQVTAPIGATQELRPNGAGLLERKGAEGSTVGVVGGEAPEMLQEALEEAYGKGNVEVTSNPPYEVYEIKFVGELTDLPVIPLELEGPYEPEELGPVKVKVLAEGRPDGEIVVTATNLGDEEANGEAQPVRIADKLPSGLKAFAIEGVVNESLSRFGTNSYALKCALGSQGECIFNGEYPGFGHESGFYGRCVPDNGYPSCVPPDEQIEMVIAVNAEEGAGGIKTGASNVASIVGGGAPAASAKQSLTVSDATAPFGVSAYEMRLEEEGGGLDTQAGSHPFQLTTTLDLNEKIDGRPTGLVKDLRFKLPPGLIGNPTPFERCPLAQFLTDSCPAKTQVGIARTTIQIFYEGKRFQIPFVQPLYELEPAVGEPARFAFLVHDEVPVFLDTVVRTGGDYGVTVNVANITQEVEFLSSEVTLWGVPAAHGTGAPPGPLLTLPTSCARNAAGEPEALQTTVEADSWAEPEKALAFGDTAPMPALDGCDRLPFSSSITVAPDGQQASTPTGLTIGIHIPQDSTLDANGLSESAVRDTTVALPEGVQISSAGAGGLLACSEEQVGFTGVEAPGGTLLYTPGPVGCPDASKVATAEVKTPLLPEPLVGAAYLAAQNQNPFGSLIALYLYAENPVAGVRVKLAGEVKLNEATGQIVTVFPNSPQVPFEEAKLHFFGGDRAPLSTPPLCGAYTSTASIAPWSGNEPSKSSSTFEITSGPNGSPCSSPRPFQPGFNAGTTSVQAGGYSPLTMTLSRPDADQALGKLAVVFPPGVSAGLRGVRLCEEPQAATGECPAESQIGTVTVSAGLGGDPYPVETGKAYITGPYEGDPFGVDVVVPAVAGPFNLGTEVVRSKVDVDPTDAHLTVVSDAFPTMLDGIPLQLQHINVNVNRPGFVFNPTSCEPMKLTGVLGSSEGATANVSTPFQVTNCAALSFKPEFKVSTSAKTSRTEGASLHVSLTLPSTPRGTAANVAKVKVSLPKQLPSPLKTLQKACTEQVFAENPSNCPKASRVGEATVKTPVLEGPLSGPAYFVSHGGAKYPELIIVLTGEDGVTVQVHGETFISKQGITTATFGTVPDVPFSNFELELPQREYPALTANGNLCKGTLIMPTEMVGQNGLVIKQSTKISVMGCPPTRPKSAHVKHSKHRAKKKRR